MPSSITNVSGVFINVLIFFAQVVIVIGNSRNLRINKPLHEKIGKFPIEPKEFRSPYHTTGRFGMNRGSDAEKG